MFKTGGTRNQFFGVFNAGLFAFFAAVHDKVGNIAVAIPVLGMFVSAVWFLAAREGRYWMPGGRGFVGCLSRRLSNRLMFFENTFLLKGHGLS